MQVSNFFIDFFEQFSAAGTCPEQNHVKDLLDARLVVNLHEVMSFFGMAKSNGGYQQIEKGH